MLPTQHKWPFLSFASCGVLVRMNCSGIITNMDSSVRLFNIITYILFFFFGATFNICALWICCCRLTKWTETTVFLVNLMVSDILIVFTLPFRIYTSLYRWNLGTDLCRTLTIFYFVNIYVSIFLISAIAFDRYLAINKPLKYKAYMSPMKAVITCCFFWTLFFAIGIIRVLLVSNRENQNTCFVKVNTTPSKLNLTFAVIGFLLPLVLICFFTVKIMKKLYIKASLNTSEQKTFKKAMNIISANLLTFVVCFLPIHAGYIVRFVAESNHSSCHTLRSISIFINVATVISNANCVLDAVCYYFAATEFQNTLCKQIQMLPKCGSFCCPK